MEGACTNCPHRQFCNTLCPEAELYVKQDEVRQKELTIGIPAYGKWPNGRSKPLFTKREVEVVALLLRGLSRDKMCQILNINRKNLQKIVERINRKSDKIIPKVLGVIYPLAI